jgi:hypothetical protein
MDEISKRQELILDHLKLKYVPETKKPAKLVEETETQKNGSDFLVDTGCSGL